MISLLKTLKDKFTYAFRGLINGFKDKSIIIQYSCLTFALFVCWLFKFSLNETFIVMLSGAIVIGFEYFNSAIEKLCDLVCIDYNPQIKKIKDLAAGAVLAASIIALIIGLTFLVKHLGGLL